MKNWTIRLLALASAASFLALVTGCSATPEATPDAAKGNGGPPQGKMVPHPKLDAPQ